jgi:hypothetical protein
MPKYEKEQFGSARFEARLTRCRATPQNKKKTRPQSGWHSRRCAVHTRTTKAKGGGLSQDVDGEGLVLVPPLHEGRHLLLGKRGGHLHDLALLIFQAFSG